MNFLSFGEIMLRLSTKNNERFSQANDLEVSFAGSESNVAVDLSNWGFKAAFFTSLPDNEMGDKVISDLKRHSVDVSFIKRKSNSRLGIIFVEKGANQLGSKVIYDRVGSAFATETFDSSFFAEVMDGKNWFHWSGITPGLGYQSIENIKAALKTAALKNLTISCDLNYRSKLWDFGVKPTEVMPELLQSAEIFTGNEEDAVIMLGLKNKEIDVNKGKINHETYNSIGQEIFKKYPKCRIIGISIRESISADHNKWSAILMTRDETFISTKHEIRNIIDRIGAGDSFTAGLIFGLSTFGEDYQKVIEFATAASCLKHSIKGDYCLVSLDEINKLISGNASGRIIR